MRTTVLLRGNRTYIKIGEKVIIVSPHAIEEMPTLSSKMRALQKELRFIYIAHFAKQRKSVLIGLREEGLNGAISSLTADNVNHRNAVKANVKEAYRLGGQHGMNAVERRKAHEVFPLQDPNVLAEIDGIAAAMVGRIDGATLDEVKSIIASGIENQQSSRQVAKVLEDRFEKWGKLGIGRQSRAEKIARTEVGRTVNLGTLRGYVETGLVTTVEVIDDEGVNPDRICANANGQIWSLETAKLHPLAHPNCTRVFSPIIVEATL